MATGGSVSQGKTAFVQEFLTSHRDAYHEAVNRAWAESGNAGSVSESLVGKVRRDLGLTGQKTTKARDAAPAKAAKSSPRAARPKAASRTQKDLSSQEGPKGDTGPSKSDFIREMLNREPGANVKAVNRAWTEAGHEGKISDTVFYNTKKELKGGAIPTTVAPRTPTAKPAKTAKAKPAIRPKAEAHPESNRRSAPAKPAAGSKTNDRERALDRVEDRIDDLIFELKRLGGMEAALEELRKVRRAVVRSHQG